MSEQVTVRENSLVIPTGFRDKTEWDTFKGTVISACESGLLPIKNTKQALVIALKGRELGLELFYALSHISVINGKCMIEGQALLALIYRKYPRAQIRYTTPAEKRWQEATVTMARFPGEEPDSFTFTMEDAKRAGLAGKGPWKAYPQDMLRWRAVAAGARFKFPDAAGGLYVPGEIESVHPVPTVNNSKEIQEAMDAGLPPEELLPFEREDSLSG